MGPSYAYIPLIDSVYFNKLTLLYGWLKNIPLTPIYINTSLLTFLAILKKYLDIVSFDIILVLAPIINNPKLAFIDRPTPTFCEDIPITTPAKSLVFGYFLNVYMSIYPPRDPPIAIGGLLG